MAVRFQRLHQRWQEGNQPFGTDAVGGCPGDSQCFLNLLPIAAFAWPLGLGITTVVEDSSGNAGASLACYAARARLQARIYVPESAPAPKKSQIAIYGAELVEVPGPRDAATQAAMAASQQDHTVQYASHAWHPAFLLGQMTLAWEIWEQLGWQVPDWFIAPVGQGGALLGAWRGFQHLQASGMTTQLPHLVAVQAEPYTPLLRALSGSIDNMLSSPRPEKISADGIAIRSPVRLESLLAAVRDSHGTAVAVSEEEVQRYRVRLAERGLFVEPTSAVVAAALDQIRSLFRPQETVVAMLTGHGLKNPPHFP